MVVDVNLSSCNCFASFIGDDDEEDANDEDEDEIK